MLYNPALLINEMILFGDTLLNMFVNVKLFSNKIKKKKKKKKKKKRATHIYLNSINK